MYLVILFFSILNLFLGIAILVHTRNKSNLVFFLFAFSASIWTLNNFYLRLYPTTFVLKLSYGIGLIVAALGLIWIYYFLEKRIPLIIKFIILPSTILLSFFTIISNQIIISLESVELLGYEAKTGNFFTLYSVFIGIIIGILIYSLIKAIGRESDILRRHQITYVLLGTLIFAITSFFVSFYIPSVFHTFKFAILDNLSFSFFLIFIVYAIVKHRLFNIKVIATELLTFSIWVFLLVRTLIAQTYQEIIINSVLLLLVFIFGIFLIRSVLKEVQQREKMEELSNKLALANEELKKLDNLKSEFISIASHQLRAPLTIIKGYLSLIKEGSLGQTTQETEGAIKKASFATGQLIKLVDSLLDLSRIESGKIQYNFSKINLTKIVEEVVQEFQTRAKEKNLGIIFNNEAAEILNISADADKIREIVVNLVDNALKYSDSGDIVITQKLMDKNKIRLEVKDNGIGINKEDQKRLFAKFIRSDDAKNRDPNGMGIGLYFAKRVIEDHNGKIWIESKGRGKGSTFLVELPLNSIPKLNA